MSTPTLEDVDVDLGQMIDAAVPPPSCEWREKRSDEPCGNPAAWIMHLACGHSYYYDEEHAAKMRHTVETGGGNLCNAPNAPRHRPYVKADPVVFERIAS